MSTITVMCACALAVLLHPSSNTTPAACLVLTTVVIMMLPELWFNIRLTLLTDSSNTIALNCIQDLQALSNLCNAAAEAQQDCAISRRWLGKLPVLLLAPPLTSSVQTVSAHSHW